MLTALAVALGAAATAAGAWALSCRSARARSSSEVGPTARGLLELHDVVLVGRTEHCLVGETSLVDGPRRLRLFVDTFAEPPTWVALTGDADEAPAVLAERRGDEVAVGGDALSDGRRRLPFVRGASARVERQGEGPVLTGPCRFALYEDASGHVGIVLDTPEGRLVLVGERPLPGSFRVLPGRPA